MESRVLTTHLKEALRHERGCAIEIRAPFGSDSHTTAQRLLKSLIVAGVKAELVDVVAAPQVGILIEASQQCARAGRVGA